ncbi:DUF481 domain-containing protein [Fulvivirga sp. M361]|uniref:DUF481 domain-containing protein n=1 Tax=Fulvivirga sp. M361 TaxID=2594266 RepID=UPI001179CE70|nr:DUF481 domain-containing protein [Fulvivirga sp. M361]TRX59370.1 DUF481 domain-containing protein [Fulvivirga sp. M361]
MKYFCLIVSLFAGCQFVSAQILKVDKGSIDSDSSQYFLGSVNMDFNINNRSTTVDQEVTFKGLSAHADLVYVAEQHAYMLINTINYFTSTGGPLISTGYAHFRINFLRRRKLSYETFTQVQYDDGRNMPFRFLQGGGIRISLSREDKVKFHLGIGGMWETERWKSLSVENGEIEKEIWKTSNYISGQFNINELVDLHLITYYQGGNDVDSDLFRNRVSGDVVFKVKLTDKLSFLTNFTLQYEDRPIIPINNMVYSLTNGLKWDF